MSAPQSSDSDADDDPNAPGGEPAESLGLEPLRATKRCRIGLVDGSPALRPAVRGTFFRPTASASCGEGHVHRVPEPSCTCGFYALGNSEELEEKLGSWRPEEVELDVELGGRVVRHERGLRGEHQAVLGVRIHPLCALCSPRNPRRTVVVGRVERGRRRADWEGLLPLCDRCASQAADLWTVPGLAAALEAEVTVDRDAETVAPSRRLTARSRVRLGVAAIVGIIYLSLGMTVAIRGVNVGTRITTDELAQARAAADEIMAGLTGSETDAAEVSDQVQVVLGRHLDTASDDVVLVDIAAGVDIAADVDGWCILATDTGAWEARAVRESTGSCTPTDARELRPVTTDPA